MASVSVTDKNHTRVTVMVSDLQEGRDQYDKFVYKFTQNGKQILAYTYDWNTGSYTSWEFEFSNDAYLGNNQFSPATTYSITVDCYAGGKAYPIGPVTFTTSSISPPSGSIAPAVYPTVKDQGQTGNCVAMSLSTAMEIFKAKAVGEGGSYENFSVSYVFGSDGESYDLMQFIGAVELCETYGSPRWELVTPSFPDSKSKSDSVNLFNKAVGLARSNAQKQAFTGHSNIDFYDCAAVASAIRNYGYFMMNFRIPYNFNSISSDGIVPQPSGGYSGGNHSIALIGLTTKNGKPHWIAQNGWGTWWGQGGRCYIPYDWGCGVQAPQDSWNTDQACSWTCECYSVWNGNVSAANPTPPTNITGVQVKDTTDATIGWTAGTSASSVLIYARRRETTDWWPKPSYGSLFAGTSGRIAFDKDTTVYELMLISVKNNLLSPQSSIVTLPISVFEPFDWTYAGRNPTTNARVAGTTKQSGLVACITANEWNSLVDAVNQRKGTSISHVSPGAVANSVAVVRPVAQALGVSVPNGFSAAFFNQLRAAVNLQ